MSNLEQVQESLVAVESAVSAGRLSQTAALNVKAWLTEDRYSEYRAEVVEHVQDELWQALDDAFWDDHKS